MASVMPSATIGLLQILLLLCAKQAMGDCTLGKATFYYPADQPGKGTGSCGTTISDTDLVGALGCALASHRFASLRFASFGRAAASLTLHDIVYHLCCARYALPVRARTRSAGLYQRQAKESQLTAPELA